LQETPVRRRRRDTGGFQQQKGLSLRCALACRDEAERMAIVICADQHHDFLLGKREPATPRVQRLCGAHERAVAQNVFLEFVEAIGMSEAGDPQPLTGKDMFHRRHPPRLDRR